MKTNNKRKFIISIIKKSFSPLLALLGILLIYLGVMDFVKVPESFYAGVGILIIALLFYIGELYVLSVTSKKYDLEMKIQKNKELKMKIQKLKLEDL